MEVLPISTITIARNAEDTIEDCLSSIQRNHPAEIIVVDGNSSDRTVEIAQKYTDRIYPDEGRGTNYARQLGAEQATQEYIGYIDADVVLPPDTLATMLNEFQVSGCAAISAQQRRGRSTTYWERAMGEHVQIIFSRKNIFGLAASLLKKDTILKYPFDCNLPRTDDGELRDRLVKDGHKLALSSAFVYHDHKADLKGFVERRFSLGISRVEYFRKHSLLLLNPAGWAPLTTVYMLGFSLVKGKPHLFLYFLLGGVIETAGMVKGFFELIGQVLRKAHT